MRLPPEDEAFVRNLIEQVRRAVEQRSGGDAGRSWRLTLRLSQVLVARAYAGLSQQLGLAKARSYDTPIEVRVGGDVHATYEAGMLRSEVWMALVGSVHGVVDAAELRDEAMARDEVGEGALPPFDRRDEPGAEPL